MSLKKLLVYSMLLTSGNSSPSTELFLREQQSNSLLPFCPWPEIQNPFLINQQHFIQQYPVCDAFGTESLIHNALQGFSQKEREKVTQLIFKAMELDFSIKHYIEAVFHGFKDFRFTLLNQKEFSYLLGFSDYDYSVGTGDFQVKAVFLQKSLNKKNYSFFPGSFSRGIVLFKGLLEKSDELEFIEVFVHEMRHAFINLVQMQYGKSPTENVNIFFRHQEKASIEAYLEKGLKRAKTLRENFDNAKKTRELTEITQISNKIKALYKSYYYRVAREKDSLTQNEYRALVEAGQIEESISIVKKEVKAGKVELTWYPSKPVEGFLKTTLMFETALELLKKDPNTSSDRYPSEVDAYMHQMIPLPIARYIFKEYFEYMDKFLTKGMGQPYKNGLPQEGDID